MTDWRSESQMIETMGFYLGQVKDTLNIFDNCVCDEMAATFRNTRDPYAHHFEDMYQMFRSLLHISISRIDQIATECSNYAEQILGASRKANVQ